VVYDEKADAKADIAAALARAKRDNKRVLIQWGANWCAGASCCTRRCRADKEIAKAIFYEYEVVRVDVGGFDKNLDLAASFGAKLKESGIPYSLCSTPRQGAGHQDTGSFELADKQKPGHDRRKFSTLLAKNQAPQLDAQKALDSALARARWKKSVSSSTSEHPGVAGCRTLEAWLRSRSWPRRWPRTSST
jgi:protein disulfide-isomerase